MTGNDTTGQDGLQRLQEENKLLKDLLTSHGIKWQEIEEDQDKISLSPKILATADKIAIFRRLFRGRDDVYAQRWESAKDKAGCSPACGNEWKSMAT